MVVFVGVATMLLGTEIGDMPTTRLVILAVVNAYALSRGLICAVRALVGPFGLLRMRAETAAYIEIWARRIVAVAISGIAFANVALLLGLHRGGYAGLLRLVMLVVHLFIVVIILQCRKQVADMIRAPDGREGIAARARNRLAAVWHYLAITLDIALWAVWALNIRNGYSLLLQYFVGTVAVILITRLATIVVLSLIDRGFSIRPEILQRFPGLETRANRYLPLLRRIVATIIAFIGFVAVLEVWGVDAVVWFYGGQIGSRLLSALATVAIAALVAAAIWEVSNALMDRQVNALSRDGHYARAARLRTFEPMLRTALLCLIVTVVGLTALSEIGVNVAPLLAGAGIVGIAIGFGSQKLVQDLITGLFLLLENGVQVGDNVSVAGLSGAVENVSIRTIRLRAADGSVHIVPFSAVTTITNASRGAGNAAVSVSVAYKEDTDRASQILKDIVAEMRKETEYRMAIRGDLELWGVDKVDGSMATIVGQIRCTDSGRWPVQREFNRRMKRRFQECGIEIASGRPDHPDACPRAGGRRRIGCNAAAGRGLAAVRMATITPRRRLVAVALRDQLACQRNELAAIVDRVDQRIEAADQEVVDAEVVIIAEHLGDLLGRSDQRRGVAVGAGELCHFRPQPLVDPRALVGEREQPLRAGRRVAVRRLAVAGLVLQRGRACENVVGLLPGLLLGVGEDRTHRQAEARARPAIFRRGRAHAGGDVADLRVGFAPQRESIGVFGRDLDRGVGAAADECIDAVLLDWLYLGKAFLDRVIFAAVVERLLAGPFQPHDVEELAGARVALVLVVEHVAVLAQLGGIAAGDHMQ